MREKKGYNDESSNRRVYYFIHTAIIQSEESIKKRKSLEVASEATKNQSYFVIFNTNIGSLTELVNFRTNWSECRERNIAEHRFSSIKNKSK